MLYSDKSNDDSVNVSPALIEENTEEKLLGVILNKKLSFDTHTQQLCITAHQKLHALLQEYPLLWTQKNL